MNQLFKRGLLLITLLLVFALYASPTWVTGIYYVNSESATKDDNNSCKTEVAPCATFAGVIDKVLASVHPENNEYNQDKKSVKQNPELKLSHPSGHGYLHLKAGSPAIGAGDGSVSFGSDDFMDSLLLKDWDLDTRPQGNKIDIGADEFVL